MIKKHIPNFLTCCNLLCGCVGIALAFEARLYEASYLIWLALIFDFLDGFTARLLKVQSDLGKHLDSLADLVTFGVLPSVLVYHMLEGNNTGAWIPYLAFAIAIFSALRLARFNIDEKQQAVFLGLPTPANALFLSSLVFVNAMHPDWLTAPILIGITIVFSLLLVSPVELFALKFKTFGWKGNQVRFVFLAGSTVLVLLFRELALPLIIIGYIVLSVMVKAFSTS